MPIFELKPLSIGLDFAAAWFDDNACLWNDERLRSPASLLKEWACPQLKLYEPKRGATPVLYNPNAYAVSEDIRNKLSLFPELEFLPVHIENHGVFYIFHVVASCELPEGCVVSRPVPPKSGNIVKIETFPLSYEPTMSFFRVLQPKDSPAGKTGRTVIGIYTNSHGAQAWQAVAGQYVSATEVACD
jgi:hypothetical protein